MVGAGREAKRRRKTLGVLWARVGVLSAEAFPSLLKGVTLSADTEVVEKPAKEETVVENATPDYAAGLVSTQVAGRSPCGIQHICLHVVCVCDVWPPGWWGEVPFQQSPCLGSAPWLFRDLVRSTLSWPQVTGHSGAPFLEGPGTLSSRNSGL